MKSSTLAALCCLLIGSFAQADDWPQFRGPDRTGVTAEKGLLKTWPKGGPTLAWTFKDAGIGFSSMSVSKGVVYTLGTDTKFADEYVIALDEKTGKELWRLKIGPIATLRGNHFWGDGPRSTPTIDGGFLYALGSQSELVCVDTAKKAVVWQKNLIKELGGKLMEAEGYPDGWGYSESPLIDGNLLLCTPGGPKGTVAALDKTTGKVEWRSVGLTNNASYTSPVVAEIHGVRQYIQTSYDNTNNQEAGFVSGIEAKTGKVLWTGNIFKQSSYAIASTPIVKGDLVYVSSGYGGGCHLFEINQKNDAATEQYAKKTFKKVKNTHGSMVRIGDYLYGHSEPNLWVCQEMKTGNVEWSDNLTLKGASGSITAAEGKLYLYSEEGEVGLVDADPKGFNLVSSLMLPLRSKVPQELPRSRGAKTWAYPVIANGHLYLRDHEYIFAFKIAN